MNEDVPQGSVGGVATAEQNPSEASAIANNAGAQDLAGAPSPAIEQTTTTLTPEQMDAEMKKGAEMGKAIIEPAPGPAKEFEGTSAQPPNQFNPLSSPDTNAAAGAIQNERADAIASANQKKPGLFGRALGKLGIKTSYENLNENKASVAPATEAPPSTGSGLTPQTPEVSPLPPGVNPALSGGETPSVPLVSAEAKANELTATNTLGSNTGSVESQSAQGPQTDSSLGGNETHDASATNDTEPPAKDATGLSPATAEVGSTTDEAKLEPNDSSAISDFDQGVAKAAGEADETVAAANKDEAEHPDLLAVEKPGPTTPEFQPTADTSEADANKAPATSLSQDLEASGEHPAQMNIEQGQSPTWPTSEPSIATPESAASETPTSSGNIPIETNAPVRPAASTDQWNASNILDVNGQGAQTEQNQSVPATPSQEITSAPSSPTIPKVETPISPTNPAETQPAEPITATLSQDMENANEHPEQLSVEQGATSTFPSSEPSTTTTEAVASEAPVSSGSILSEPATAEAPSGPIGVVGETQPQNAVQTNGDYPGETATPRPPAQPEAPSTPDNVTPINPSVTVEPNGPGQGVQGGQEEINPNTGSVTQDQQQAA